MTTPDIGNLDLSDLDAEDLFASPSKASNPLSSAAPNAPPQRNGESKYDAEQAREALLRKELQSVRGINEVIEGVVSSLEVAKGNMEVRLRNLPHYALLILTSYNDGLTNSHICIYASQYLDSNTITDRA